MINSYTDNYAEAFQMFDGEAYGNPYKLFLMLTKEFPCKYNFHEIQKRELLDAVLEKYSINQSGIIKSETIRNEKSDDDLRTVIVPIYHNIYLYYNPGFNHSQGVEVLYGASANKEHLSELLEMIQKFRVSDSTLGKVFMLQSGDYAPELKPYELKFIPSSLSEYYNDDFEDINKIIIKRLNANDDKGLVLLHGKSGTGKTSYIRYLSNQINKKLIFLSPELAQKISSPEFLNIISAYTNSVLIIEDAENIIESRKGGGDSAISNILNLTDGLLGDCLKIQLICSFNTNLNNIDKALLRKGRLIAKYEFKELEKNKAQKLSDNLGFNTVITEDTLLTDIFHQDEKNYSQTISSMGFLVNP